MAVASQKRVRVIRNTRLIGLGILAANGEPEAGPGTVVDLPRAVANELALAKRVEIVDGDTPLTKKFMPLASPVLEKLMRQSASIDPRVVQDQIDGAIDEAKAQLDRDFDKRVQAAVDAALPSLVAAEVAKALGEKTPAPPKTK